MSLGWSRNQLENIRNSEYPKRFLYSMLLLALDKNMNLSDEFVLKRFVA